MKVLFQTTTQNNYLATLVEMEVNLIRYVPKTHKLTQLCELFDNKTSCLSRRDVKTFFEDK